MVRRIFLSSFSNLILNVAEICRQQPGAVSASQCEEVPEKIFVAKELALVGGKLVEVDRSASLAWHLRTRPVLCGQRSNPNGKRVDTSTSRTQPGQKPAGARAISCAAIQLRGRL